jgi:hypothetical protein
VITKAPPPDLSCSIAERRRFRHVTAIGLVRRSHGKAHLSLLGGSSWSNQVSDGGTAGADPIELDEITGSTPPAPGTQAPGIQPNATPSPGVEVTQRSGGTGAGILGVLVGAIIVIVILFVLFNNAGDDGTTPTDAPSVTEPSEEPAPTEAPATTAAP